MFNGYHYPNIHSDNAETKEELLKSLETLHPIPICVLVENSIWIFVERDADETTHGVFEYSNFVGRCSESIFQTLGSLQEIDNIAKVDGYDLEQSIFFLNSLSKPSEEIPIPVTKEQADLFRKKDTLFNAPTFLPDKGRQCQRTTRKGERCIYHSKCNYQ